MSNLAKSCHLRLAPFTSITLQEIHKFVGRIRQIGLVAQQCSNCEHVPPRPIHTPEISEEKILVEVGTEHSPSPVPTSEEG